MSQNISQIISNSYQQNLQDGGISLKNGQIIRATVLGKLPDGGTLLSVNGKQLDASQGLDLPEGSRHLFQVSMTGSKIDLKLLDPPPMKPDAQSATISPSATKNNLSDIISELSAALDQAELRDVAARGTKDLKQIMPSILYSDPGKNNGTWIKENILAGGILWENKVAEFLSDENNGSLKRLMKGDLKAILLSLQKALPTEDSDHSNDLTTKVRHALNLIENNQNLNLSALEDGLGWLFFIQGLEKDGFCKADVLVKKGKNNKGISFSVLAEFTRLGRFEAHVSMTASGISIRILMDDEDKAGIVNDNLPVLEAGLKTLGLNNISLSCDERKATDLTEGLAGYLPRPSQAVDIVI
jgi:hypothetical protein